MRFIYGLIFILFSGIACAHDSHRSDEGEPCGGFAGLRCKKGLICEPHPTIIDEFGICVAK